MAKKSFSGGLNTILGEIGNDKTTTSAKTTSKVLDHILDDTRVTFVLPEELVEKLRAVAYWKRMHIRQVVEEALTDYIKKERPKPRPEEARVLEVKKRAKRFKSKDSKPKLAKY